MNPLQSVSMIFRSALVAVLAVFALSTSACASLDVQAPRSDSFIEFTPHARISNAPMQLVKPQAQPCTADSVSCLKFEGAEAERLVHFGQAAITNTNAAVLAIDAHNKLADEADLLYRQAQVLEADYNRLGQLWAQAEADAHAANRWRQWDNWITRAALVGVVISATD